MFLDQKKHCMATAFAWSPRSPPARAASIVSRWLLVLLLFSSTSPPPPPPRLASQEVYEFYVPSSVHAKGSDLANTTASSMLGQIFPPFGKFNNSVLCVTDSPFIFGREHLAGSSAAAFPEKPSSEGFGEVSLMRHLFLCIFIGPSPQFRFRSFAGLQVEMVGVGSQVGRGCCADMPEYCIFLYLLAEQHLLPGWKALEGASVSLPSSHAPVDNWVRSLSLQEGKLMACGASLQQPFAVLLLLIPPHEICCSAFLRNIPHGINQSGWSSVSSASDLLRGTFKRSSR